MDFINSLDRIELASGFILKWGAKMNNKLNSNWIQILPT
jgi:hypothetical protein